MNSKLNDAEQAQLARIVNDDVLFLDALCEYNWDTELVANAVERNDYSALGVELRAALAQSARRFAERDEAPDLLDGDEDTAATETYLEQRQLVSALNGGRDW